MLGRGRCLDFLPKPVGRAVPHKAVFGLRCQVFGFGMFSGVSHAVTSCGILQDMEENETNVTADLADEDDDRDEDATQGSEAPQEQVQAEEAAKEEVQDDSS